MKEDNELFERARKRVQSQMHNKCVSDKDVIIYQEKEIEYYRNKIQGLQRIINERTENKNKITIPVECQGLEKIKKQLEDCKNIIKEIKELDSSFSLSNIIEADNNTTLVFELDMMLKSKELDDIEKVLTDRLQCKCIILNKGMSLKQGIKVGVDYAKGKDYTTTTWYDAEGNPIKEETIQYK